MFDVMWLEKAKYNEVISKTNKRANHEKQHALQN